MSEAAQAPVMFNPFDPAFRADPYPTYRRLLAEDPVHQSPFGALVLTRYADCAAVLRHPAASSDFRKIEGWDEIVRSQGFDPFQLREETRPFLFLDPPDHTRLRSLVVKAFTPRVVENLRPRIAAIVKELIDAREGSGRMDIIEDVAYPLPVQVICEMMGVPAEDNVRFRAWTADAARSLDPEETLSKEEQERRQQTFDNFRAFFAELIARRRAEPRDDLISALIAAEDEGSKLNEEELLSTCVLLLIAGHETTVNLIGNGMLALLRHPGQLQRLREDPQIIATAVEELLRYDPPVQLTGRIALEDIALSGGETVPKGKQAVLLLGAANHDPAQYADPDKLDLGREDNRHLAFGMGIHYCLGAPLARVEGQIAIGEMVRRLRDVELATAAPTYKEQLTLRGLTSLPVNFAA